MPKKQSDPELSKQARSIISQAEHTSLDVDVIGGCLKGPFTVAFTYLQRDEVCEIINAVLDVRGEERINWQPESPVGRLALVRCDYGKQLEMVGIVAKTGCVTNLSNPISHAKHISDVNLVLVWREDRSKMSDTAYIEPHNCTVIRELGNP